MISDGNKTASVEVISTETLNLKDYGKVYNLKEATLIEGEFRKLIILMYILQILKLHQRKVS